MDSSVLRVSLALPLLLVGGRVASEEVHGAGSARVGPILAKWSEQYHARHPSVTIQYDVIGSGAGQEKLKSGGVDFAATDVPLGDPEASQFADPPLQIPVVGTAIAVIYHLPESVKPLQLTGPVIADMFVGKITRWNDRRIAELNPSASLPNIPIVVAHRSDGSGTSYAFTQYLSAVSPEWKSRVGVGIWVDWPTGLGGKGCEGVAGIVKQTPGAVSYDELAYAISGRISYARVRNRAGRFIRPGTGATTSAMAGAEEALRQEIRSPIGNPAGREAYPICSMTYVLLPGRPKDPAKGQAVRDFLAWVLTAGQATEPEKRFYAPLPQGLRDRCLHELTAPQSPR